MHSPVSSMKRSLKICSLGLSIILGAGLFVGVGHAAKCDVPVKAQKKTVHVFREASLVENLLMTDRGALDISKKKALFFSPDAGCQEALKEAKELPPEKRPYLIAFCGSSEEIELELRKAGLSGAEWYRCRGIPPTITVPSVVWVGGNVKKEYTCSAAVELLDEMKYPILISQAELPSVPGPAGNNAIRALMSFNGAVINPGEEFSFYGYVGVPSPDRGYLPARSLMETPDGPVWFQDIGGGICKAATLLNFAVEKVPGLEVTEVHHHTRPVSYAPEGKDVAVARSSGWDYRFKNSRERPVQIKAYWDDSTLRIEIWELASRSFLTKETQ